MITRRALAALALLAALPPVRAGAAEDTGRPRLGPPEPMDLDRLAGIAERLRAGPYVPTPQAPAPAVLDALTYGPLQDIAYPPANGLYPNSPSPVTFFHLGNFFRTPVRIYALQDGQAREVLHDRSLFAVPAGNPAERMPDGVGFAGFRLQDAPAGKPGDAADWVAFLGASYFRAAGDGGQYGISARGVAIDTAPGPGRTEEFPSFTRFYVSPERDGTVTVLALLDGPSLTGAYRFDMRRTPHAAIDVSCRLFMRRRVERLGIAPMSSMFWYDEGQSKYLASEWRPEIHDSDGLLMRTGAGEAIWRPLNNPPRVTVNAFADRSPRGFGLLQRDRAFDHYVDDGAMERRPHLWVEPKGDWGAGSVQLVEIPTTRETDDNVALMWVPADAPGAGETRAFAYRLRWPIEEPVPSDLARCVATRASKARWVAGADRRPGRQDLRRDFVVEFEGRALDGLEPGKAAARIEPTRGSVEDVAIDYAPYGKGAPWRVSFTVYAEGPEPVGIRMFLAADGRTLSETWLAQYHPEQAGTTL